MIVPITSDTATADSIEAAAKAASHNDTLHFIPVKGHAFVLTRPIDLTGTTTDPNGNTIAKRLFIDAVGAELYAQFPLSGTQAMITWGAPLGLRTSGLSWRGGDLVGSLAVQNVSYAKHIDPESVCTLIVQADSACAYNDFHIGAMDAGAGNSSALIFNHLKPDAWCNCNVIHGCSMHGSMVNGVMGPTIWQVNQALTEGLMLTMNKCRFEGDNQTLLNMGKNVSVTFDQCYAEGSWVQGIGGGTESFTWHDMPAKWAGWLADPRNIHSGVLQ